MGLGAHYRNVVRTFTAASAVDGFRHEALRMLGHTADAAVTVLQVTPALVRCAAGLPCCQPAQWGHHTHAVMPEHAYPRMCTPPSDKHRAAPAT